MLTPPQPEQAKGEVGTVWSVHVCHSYNMLGLDSNQGILKEVCEAHEEHCGCDQEIGKEYEVDK